MKSYMQKKENIIQNQFREMVYICKMFIINIH